MDSRCGLTDRREDPHLRRGDRDPARQRDRSLMQILAAEAGVLARVAVLHDAYALNTGVGVLHAHDRIRALGKWRARHDARGLARSEYACGERARSDRFEHRQLDRMRLARAEHIICAHGVPVHRRVGPVRECDRRDDVAREDSAERVAQRDRFVRERRDVLENACDRFGDREHQGAPSDAPASVARARKTTSASCTRSTSRLATTWLLERIEKSTRRPSADVT